MYYAICRWKEGDQYGYVIKEGFTCYQTKTQMIKCVAELLKNDIYIEIKVEQVNE